MTRTDANQIAFRAVRNLLDGSRPLALVVSGTNVQCAVSRPSARKWPEHPVVGLDEATDGPWPAPVEVTCTWEGGRSTLLVECDFFRSKKKYRHYVGVSLTRGDQEVVWTNVRAALDEAEDGTSVGVVAKASTFKRKRDASDDLGARLNEALHELMTESGLPMLSASTTELCRVDVPSGTIAGGADKAFERLVHLALLKLEFVDRGAGATERKTPLVDLARWGFTAKDLAGDTDADEREDEVEPTGGRRYWAGGFHDKEHLKEFLEKREWRILWKRDSEAKAAKRTWKRFAEIDVGDWFAIKGIGGSHDLKIRFVGEVTRIDAETGTVGLRKLDVSLYEGKGPIKRGAGNWQDTLVPITRPDIIEQIFGVPEDDSTGGDPQPRPEIALNLILYGPPGTGKTYALRQRYMKAFTREANAGSWHGSLVEDLTWWQTIAIALHDLGGHSDVDGLIAHPLLRAKYAVNGARVNLRTRIWSTLGHHAVLHSETVKGTDRSGALIFDKAENGKWFLTEKLSEDLVERAKLLKQAPPATAGHDYDFVTFHQAYSYEDFIEGIRPQLDDDGDEGGKLGYVRKDGVFKRAARAALGLTKYRGSLEEFCGLTRGERAQYLEDAPPYALFIDEINRGNVARVFGELITLLEEDKRLGEPNELIVTLPYSRQPFGVPSNLHVIGTMNTADRSVEALDAALRRRFEFEELAPDLRDLDYAVEGVEIAKLLQVINLRLEVLAGRDHCIGHAYLLEIDDLDGLKRVFKRKLIPLLQEYFFGDWGKIGLVLGEKFVVARPSGQIELAAFDHPERGSLSERVTWELGKIDELTNLDFQRIYDASVASP